MERSSEKGRALEDMVGDLFTRWGFDVQKRVRMKDRFGVEHEIDVLGSKREAFGLLFVAVECKYVSSPISIKEIRNFNDKLLALGITKGVFVSTAGFTSDALAHAKTTGIEAWDLATLQEKLASQASVEDVIEDAVALSQELDGLLYPRGLRNPRALELISSELLYYPYYFIRYRCFSQDRVAGELVNLESRGTVAIGAFDGLVYGCSVEAGEEPNLERRGYISECFELPTKTVLKSQISSKIRLDKIEKVSPKLTETEAKRLAEVELTKSLAMKVSYESGGRRKEKTVRPRRSDVEAVSAKLVHVPFLTSTFRCGEKSYVRVFQAATARLLKDDMRLCSLCPKPTAFVCEECGATLCEAHGLRCSVCEKPLCPRHSVSKGLLMKKRYCPEHAR